MKSNIYDKYGNYIGKIDGQNDARQDIYDNHGQRVASIVPKVNGMGCAGAILLIMLFLGVGLGMVMSFVYLWYIWLPELAFSIVFPLMTKPLKASNSAPHFQPVVTFIVVFVANYYLVLRNPEILNVMWGAGSSDSVLYIVLMWIAAFLVSEVMAAISGLCLGKR